MAIHVNGPFLYPSKQNEAAKKAQEMMDDLAKKIADAAAAGTTNNAPDTQHSV